METTGDVDIDNWKPRHVFETLCRSHPIVSDVIDDDSVLSEMLTLPISRRRPFSVIWENAQRGTLYILKQTLYILK